MFKKKLNLKVSWETLKVVITLTVIFTGIGFLFGRILENVFFDLNTQPASALEESTLMTEGEVESPEDTTAEVSEVAPHSENTIFLMQIGVFETLDNALALGGRLDSLGFTWNFNRLDGRFYVVTHIVGDRSQLIEVEEELRRHDLNPFIRPVEVDPTDLEWYYFLKAVQQVPFEMSSDFIQMFANDELHIFGLYVTLSSVSFEALSSERQEVLLQVYNWLTS